MRRKWMFLFRVLVLFSLLIAPLGPADAQHLLPPPPSPKNLSPEIEQARARQAMEAVLAKYLAYWGPRYQLSLGEVTVEGEWAHGVTEGQSKAKTLSGPIHLLAHRSADGTWQALLPGTDEAYLQWLEAVPASLVSKSEKSQLSAQAAEADALRQPQATPAVPTAASTISPGEEGLVGPVKPITGETQSTPTPTPKSGTQETGIVTNAPRQSQATPIVPPAPSAIPTSKEGQGGLNGPVSGQAQLFGAGNLPSARAQEAGTPEPGKYYTVNTATLSDGTVIEEVIINGPPVPPPGFEIERQAVSLPEPDSAAGINVLTVPAFNWVFGCSAVSGAMIAGYYDRSGFSNMYTGPTNSGVMPLNNSSWPTWSDGSATYPSCPLIASKNGVDGRATRGSIDDYWVQYNSSASDPYITNGWTQHTWGDAIGDYMKTSQSAFSNTDGSTAFYNYTSSASQLTCATMAGSSLPDGTLGRKLFYEAKGYTVADCYNQKTDNTIAGGFSFAQFKAEIDAGRPVMLNLAGHTVVGVGYDDSSNLVYIHDTWDYNNHTMTWGSSYSGMALQSVSIVNIQDITPLSANFDAWPQSGNAPLTVAMHIVDTANITSCSWDYGDGYTGTSCASYHNHVYNNPGLYSVSLTVSGPGGSHQKLRIDYIRVEGPAITTPSNPSPGDGTTLERTNDTTLSWSTNGTSCTIHIWGGSIDINPSGSCSSLPLHAQRGGDYHWQVTASNSSGSATGPTWGFKIKPYGPTNLAATAISPTQITLNWMVSSDEPSDIDGYDVYYSNGTLINSVAKGISTYTVNSLSCTNTYSFYVKSRRQNVSSNPSNTVSQQPQACDSEKPVVNWIAPVSNGQTHHVTNQTVQLQVDASDNVSVARVHFYRWDAVNLVYVEIGNVYSSPYQINLDSTVLNYDWNEIFAEAYDGAGNVSDRKYIWLFRDSPIPDLQPFAPSGYTMPAIPSSTQGTHTTDTLHAGQPTYFDWHFINSGSGTASGSFHVDLWVDDTRYISYPYSNYPSGATGGFDDWGITIPTSGWHNVKLVTDPDNTVVESNETNNVWEHLFYWTPVAPFTDNFESGIGDWTASGLWHQVDAASPYLENHSATHSWWYGQDSTGNYNTGAANSGNLTSPAIYIPAAGYYLRFWQWYKTETQGQDWDQRWVQISVDGGVFSNILQLSDDPMNLWLQSPAINLSGYAGHTIQVRFNFDTLDDYANSNRGWYIDDFNISTTPPPSCADSHEPNNSTSQATGISYGQTLSADICPGGDFDFYTFTGMAGDKIVVNIDAKVNSSWLDSYVILLDSDGTSILAENDDEIIYEVQDSILGYQLPHDGNYYIKVKAWNHPSVGDPNYFYTIHLLTDDVNPSSAAITSPANNAWLNPSMETVTVTASDNESGINRVEFLWHSADWENSDWVWLGADYYSPDGWNWNFDTSSLPEQRGGAFYIWAFDWAGNWTGAGSWNLGIDRTPPTVVSSLRANSNPTAASSVDFTVTFSESVTDVVTGDFNLTKTGTISGESVTGVSGGPTIYTVSVNTGTGNGTLRLDVNSSGTGITDTAGNPLSGGFTSGETYTITKEYTLTITSAHGTVARNPNQATYHEGDVVQLTATPNTGWSFANWTGGLTGIANPGFVTIHGDTSVTANYTQNVYTLSVNKAGTGSGTVTSSPAGINCGATCSYAFVYNTVVTLTATPTAGHTFTGWSGAGCSGTDTCSVTMSAATTVTANFTVNPTCYTLITSVGPIGSGSVGVNPASNCTGEKYTSGTVVTLTATANSGYGFSSWSGSVTGSTNPTTVTMNGDKSVTANFTVNPTCYTLITSVGPIGSGSVGVNPVSNCTGGKYTSGTVVTLTATANSGYGFSSWSGSITGSTNPTPVTMNGDKSVTANFNVNPTCYTLTTSVGPIGSGSVGVNPVSNCTGGKYTSGTVVTLTATANSGYGFSSWSGSITGSTNPTPVTMNGDKSVTANFTIDNTPPVITEGASVNVNMSQNGSPTPFSLTLHATDANGDTIAWSISTLAGHGTASANGTGTSKAITYTPALNYIGSDSFVVQVSDGNGGTDTITVNVTITAVGPTPFTIFLPLILR